MTYAHASSELKRLSTAFATVALTFLSLDSLASANIHGPLCVWKDDPCTSMSVQWLRKADSEAIANVWLIGKSGFGYDDEGKHPMETVLGMKNNFNTIYIRRHFDLPQWSTTRNDPDLEKFKLSLRVRYDDGIIAYLNGQEIVRAHVKEGAGHGAKGIESHEATKEGTLFPISDAHHKLLKAKGNILAIECHNQKQDSSDLTLEPRLIIEELSGKKEKKDLIGPNETWAYLLGVVDKDWQTAEIAPKAPEFFADSSSKLSFFYRAQGSDQLKSATLETAQVHDLPWEVLSVDLEGLEPNQIYHCQIEDRSGKVRLPQRQFSFKTAPLRMTQPLRFVTGGAMNKEKGTLINMNLQAGVQNPLFALLGGDLAYGDGKNGDKWAEWIDAWAQNALTSDRHSIPIIATLGNHEVAKGYAGASEKDRKAYPPRKNAPFFFNLCRAKETSESHQVVDFGDYLSVICLDTGHTQEVKDQRDWLAQTLKVRAARPHLFACYHQDAFGVSVKGDQGQVQKHWLPLFETHGVDAVFENDLNCYKRLHRITKGKRNAAGVLFLGSGGWGIKPGKTDFRSRQSLPYFATAENRSHLIRVTLQDDRQQFDALEANGRLFDGTTLWK